MITKPALCFVSTRFPGFARNDSGNVSWKKTHSKWQERGRPVVAPTENKYKSLFFSLAYFFSLAPFVFCHVEQAKRSHFISRKRCLIFFLCIKQHNIPSKQYHIKKRRNKIPSFKKFMFVNRLLRKGKQQPCHRFVVHILARGNNRFNRYLGFLFYRTVWI